MDTTGSGDAFLAAVAVRLAAGDDLPDAARYAVRAGALAVTVAGAQLPRSATPSAPLRAVGPSNAGVPAGRHPAGTPVPAPRVPARGRCPLCRPALSIRLGARSPERTSRSARFEGRAQRTVSVMVSPGSASLPEPGSCPMTPSAARPNGKLRSTRPRSRLAQQGLGLVGAHPDDERHRGRGLATGGAVVGAGRARHRGW
nr:PfkB family carbohydrate kinase [Pseudonocardia sp. ICBG601]